MDEVRDGVLDGSRDHGRILPRLLDEAYIMNRLLFVDTETRTIEATSCSILEVGVVLWDIDTRSVLSTWSSIVHREPINEAEAINRIPPALLVAGEPWERVCDRLWDSMREADVLLAHNAVFDRTHIAANGGMHMGGIPPWVCTFEDMDWPSVPGSHALTAIALAYDVGIVQAHRALADVTLMARLFERMAERGEDIRALLTRALRPKGFFKALVPYEERELAKTARFRWNDPIEGAWTKNVALEDVGLLPFRVQRIDEKGEPWLDPAFCNSLHPTELRNPPLRCQAPVKHSGCHVAAVSPTLTKTW